MNVPGLYLVLTEPIAGYAACAEAAVQAGLQYVQLRMKDAPSVDTIRIGHDIRSITRGTGTRFIVNDDVEIARTVDADGLHLGQTDMAIDVAKRCWPTSTPKIFGLSTHSEAQAVAAESKAPSYIGVGPVYATPTKRIADPTLGVARTAAIVQKSKIPTVAIGGIDRVRLPELLAAGICSFAVVRYVCERAQPLDAIRELLDTATEYLTRSADPETARVTGQ